ncbi:MAG: bifunctional (p)ppGpp synthetase/guanosine-3',5'-bis(diphosphate) 3'-pyrophosphohydrolase, partial [Muribaculaceae bacterium]|nr:bifunctional (p)ppGpp synthetase/guanosine-3',5'-bis(diphosphate) 3'-pyrophosphohydrolase [Muribaculaceae bacterium]
DWLDHSVSYKARRAITSYLSKQPKPEFLRCDHCHPIPGEEVIGFKGPDGKITVHKRDCSVAIRLASQLGDNIVSVNYRKDHTVYPVELIITCIDRPHMIIDIMDCISNKLALSVESLNTSTEDAIVSLKIRMGVHDFSEIQTITAAINAIPDVEEVRATTLN